MATLTVQTITESGLDDATYSSAAGGGDVADNRLGTTFLHIKNGSGAPITVTVTAQTTDATSPTWGTLTKASASTSVSAGGESFMGPFPQNAFNNSSNQIAISYSGVTSLTIAALKLD